MRSEPMQSRFAVALVVTFILSIATEAHAQENPPLPDRARSEVARAVKAYELKEFGQALAHYTEAYRLDPRPGMLFNIAQCHRQLNEHAKAAFFYRRYLAQYPEGVPHAELVQRFIEEMDLQVATDVPRASVPVAEPAMTVEAPAQVMQVDPAALVAPPVAPMESRSVFTRWWFWTGVAAAVVATGAAVHLATSEEPRTTTLGTWDLR